MIEELAVVVKIDKHQVWVESGQAGACGGCLQKASCTTNAIGSVLKKKSVPVDCDMSLQIGDKVMVAIDEKPAVKRLVIIVSIAVNRIICRCRHRRSADG